MFQCLFHELYLFGILFAQDDDEIPTDKKLEISLFRVCFWIQNFAPNSVLFYSVVDLAILV